MADNAGRSAYSGKRFRLWDLPNNTTRRQQCCSVHSPRVRARPCFGGAPFMAAVARQQARAGAVLQQRAAALR